MKISLLQPEIIRGSIEHNRMTIQRLIDQSEGDLLVLPEYALTGSLVLESQADVGDWASRCRQAKAELQVPPGRYVLLNALMEVEGLLYNVCELLPDGEVYAKLFPDPTETAAGIRPGLDQKTFSLFGKRFKVLICYDLPHLDRIPLENLDFLLFIYHFTPGNRARVMGEVIEASQKYGLPILASSLVSDQNNGYSAYAAGDVSVSLSNREGILEVEIK